MLKRKRVSKRSTNNSRKGRNSISGSAASAGNADSADSQAASSASAAAAAGFDMPQLVYANAHGHSESSSTTTPSRRSKFADRYYLYITSALFRGGKSYMVRETQKGRQCGFGQSLGRPIVWSISHYFSQPKKGFQSQRPDYLFLVQSRYSRVTNFQKRREKNQKSGQKKLSDLRQDNFLLFDKKK